MNKVDTIMEKLTKESIEEIENYDVKDDFTGASRVLTEKDPIKKILLYKEDAKGKSFDCDVALRTVVIYNLAWGAGDSRAISLHGTGFKHTFRWGNIQMLGDTMHSFWTPYKYAIQDLTPNYKELCSKLGITGSLQNSILEHYNAFNLGRLHSLFTEWAKLTHTVGSFIPIPPNVNVPRFQVTGDYWDLMMYAVYQWYNGNTNYIRTIFGAENLDCVYWLHTFKTWESFVEKNYLQDFVCRGNEQPLEFFKGHFSRFDDYIRSGRRGVYAVRKYLVPRTEEEIESHISFVVNATKSRGLRIAKAVKTALDKRVIYSEVR